MESNKKSGIDMRQKHNLNIIGNTLRIVAEPPPMAEPPPLAKRRPARQRRDAKGYFLLWPWLERIVGCPPPLLRARFRFRWGGVNLRYGV